VSLFFGVIAFQTDETGKEKGAKKRWNKKKNGWKEEKRLSTTPPAA
jgi:hypothetical protein